MRRLPPDMPVVAVGAGDDLPVPVASVDHRAGAVRAVRHLLSLGHETVWHMAGPADWIDALAACRGPAIAIIESGATPADVRRAVGVARKALLDVATLESALIALRDALDAASPQASAP